MAVQGRRDARWRRRLVAALVMAPAVLVAIAVSGIEGWRVVRPRSPLFMPPFAYSLAEAIAMGDVQQAYGYIRAGQDPTQPIPVRHPTLTRGRGVMVPPLIWAVATGHTQIVKMLLGYGVPRHGPQYRQAVCLADALGHDELGRVLRTLRTSGQYDDGCGAGPAGGTPLLHLPEAPGRAVS